MRPCRCLLLATGGINQALGGALRHLQPTPIVAQQAHASGGHQGQAERYRPGLPPVGADQACRTSSLHLDVFSVSTADTQTAAHAGASRQEAADAIGVTPSCRRVPTVPAPAMCRESAPRSLDDEAPRRELRRYVGP